MRKAATSRKQPSPDLTPALKPISPIFPTYSGRGLFGAPTKEILKIIMNNNNNNN